MYKTPLKFTIAKSLHRSLLAVLFTSSILISSLSDQAAVAQVMQLCEPSPKAVKEKENLRLSALKGNRKAQNRYQKLLKEHAEELKWYKIYDAGQRLYVKKIKER